MDIPVFFQSVGFAILFVAAYGGIIGLIVLSAYFLIRLISKPIAKVVSHFTMIQAKKSVSRLLPSSRSFLLKDIKNEEQLSQMMKSIAIKNGWKKEDIDNMPIWLLTGHLVADANPNLFFGNSGWNDRYHETDMN